MFLNVLSECVFNYILIMRIYIIHNNSCGNVIFSFRWTSVFYGLGSGNTSSKDGSLQDKPIQFPEIKNKVGIAFNVLLF